MTAEIAILNKSAVAMAADSAVTISGQDGQEKIFDSGDKLFELSFTNPIGVMIYSNLHFMNIPMQVLIKEFRKTCNEFPTVEKAAQELLAYLSKIGKKSSQEEKRNSYKDMLLSALKEMSETIQSKIFNQVLNIKTPQSVSQDTFLSLIDESFAEFEDSVVKWGFGNFITPNNTKSKNAKKDIKFSDKQKEYFNELIKEIFADIPLIVESQEYLDKLVSFSERILKSAYLSPTKTGVVVAGYGRDEMFPTLVSYEIDGMVGDYLKFQKNHIHDIDRQGPTAAIIPFAQTEMVDRFLFGLDDQIRNQIEEYCRKSVSTIGDSVFKKIALQEQGEEAKLKNEIEKAENDFVNNLSNLFNEIFTSSRAAFGGIIEFMPKPELAKTAEALVDLTSIKRKVTRGFETVGGPVDVLVISRAEGLVWVKRKHYFPRELNSRYFDRVSLEKRNNYQPDDGVSNEAKQ